MKGKSENEYSLQRLLDLVFNFPNGSKQIRTFKMSHWFPGVSLQVGNLGLLFMLLFFIFAALGVELFGDLSKDTCSMHTGKPDKVQTAAFRQNIPQSACTGMRRVLHFPICEFNQLDVNCVRESLAGLCPWSLQWVQIAGLGNTISCCHSWCPIKSFFFQLSASLSLSMWRVAPVRRSRTLRHVQELWDGVPAALQGVNRRQLERHHEGESNSWLKDKRTHLFCINSQLFR